MELLLLCGVGVGALIFISWPRPSKYVRRTTKSYNSRPLGREKDLY